MTMGAGDVSMVGPEVLEVLRGPRVGAGERGRPGGRAPMSRTGRPRGTDRRPPRTPERAPRRR